VVHYCRLGPTFPRRFRRLLREGRYDCVHAHVHWLSGLILRLGAQVGTPLRMVHFRNTESRRPLGLRHRLQYALMRRWIDRYATHILGNGEGSLAQGWSPQWRSDPRCAVIHNGLDTTRFRQPADRAGVRREFGWPEGCPLLLHVGRMDQQKNHPRLVEIAGSLLRQDPALRLLLVGRESSPLKERLWERLRHWGVQDRAVMTGVRGDVPRLMKAADLLLFPSLWEGLPGAVLEACAAGLPVLASDLPGIREIAARLENVQCLSLEESDHRWVAAARGLLALPSTEATRQESLRRVDDSVYSISRCIETHCRVWSGAAGSEIRQSDV
jgi:glycosyltransferase involved in cell wall biosynthesis